MCIFRKHNLCASLPWCWATQFKQSDFRTQQRCTPLGRMRSRKRKQMRKNNETHLYCLVGVSLPSPQVIHK